MHSHATDKELLIASLSEIASLINSGQDIETILKQLIYAACHHAKWLRGSIMSVDLENGYAHVTVRYDPTLIPFEGGKDWVLAKSPSIVALRHNEPVFIRNAKTAAEFPGFQKEALERDYCSVLVMPLSVSDAKGRPIVLTVVSREIRDLTSADLSLMKMIVQMGTIALEKQKTILWQQEVAEQNKEILSKHIQWMDHALSDESVPTLVALMSNEFKQPLLVVDLTTNTIHNGRSPNQSILSDDEWRQLVENELNAKIRSMVPQLFEANPRAAIELTYSKRHQTYKVTIRYHCLGIDGSLVGALVLLGDAEINDTDQLLIESAKQSLSVQLMRNLIRFRFEQRTLSELFGEIIEERSKDEADIIQRALKFGINISKIHYMFAISSPLVKPEAWMNIHRQMTLAAERFDPPASFVVREDGIVVWLPSNVALNNVQLQKIAIILMKNTIEYSREKPLVVISEGCTHIREYPMRYRQLYNVVQVANSMGRNGVVRAEDLGPLGMLLISADADYIHNFTRDKLGLILKYDENHGTELFETLKSLIQTSFRNQQCADLLNIHVTTLRYRITRLQELFKLDLQNSDVRFELELAMRLSQFVFITNWSAP